VLKLHYAFLAASFVLAGCGTHLAMPGDSKSLPHARAAEVETSVRAFVQTVAHDVTQDGPLAWRRHLADSPAFFMAANGQLVFPNSAAATAGIQAFAPTVKQIELRWGDDLRVDPLTPDLAVVASTYHEIRVSASGQRVDETGFFTGTAEFRDCRWEFRNAHWSVPVPPPPVP
jgi:hypothetical protein